LIVAGIDYSITSPSMCVFEGEQWSIDCCSFYVSTTDNKWGLIKWDMFASNKDFVYWHKNLDSSYLNAHRFDNLASYYNDVVKYRGIEHLAMEDYAFAAKGLVFNIAECTGLLKQHFWMANIEFSLYKPTEVKKFATGKGNANKEKMVEAFVEDSGFDIFCFFGTDSIKGNPITDIADSYWICKKKWSDVNESK